MTYEHLARHIEDISKKAYDKGLNQIMACQSPTLLAQEHPKLLQLCFVDLPAAFQPYLNVPNPASFNPLIGDVDQALGRLNTETSHTDPLSKTEGAEPYPANTRLDELPAAGDFIQNWTGEAARVFKATFIDKFSSLVRNQFLLVSTLKAALLAEQAVWKAARDDIDEIAHLTLKAIDASGDGMCPRQTEWTLTFSVLSAVVGIGLAGPTGGLSLALTTVGAAASVVSNIPIEKPPRPAGSGPKIGGGDAAQVLRSTIRAIAAATKATNDTEFFVAQRIRGLVGNVRARPGEFVSPRPALRDMPANEATDGRYLGYST